MPLPEFVRNLLKAPERFEGGLIPNVLGYHALRILRYKLGFAARGKIVPKDAAARRAAEAVADEGIVVIPDFFPREIFSKIKAEADGLALGVFNERAPRLLRSVFVAEGRPSNPVLEEHFVNDAFMRSVVSGALRKEILIKPTVQVERSWYAQEDLGKESTDKADNLHFDVSYPTIKCFLYLNDVDASNAAFSYARRSHKMTFARAWMECGMSVKFWFWDKKRRDTVTPEVDQEFLKKNGLEVVSIEGKANTLIIVNTMGFHQRGQYRTTTPREMVIVSYRPLETFKYFTREILKKLGR